MFDFRKIITAACDAVAETLYPTRCVGCDFSGLLLCESCNCALPRIDLASACRRCGAPFGALVCTECPAPGTTDQDGKLLPLPFSFDSARCACSYEGTAKRLIAAYKDGDEQRLSAHIAREIARVAAGVDEDENWLLQADAIVAVPPNPAHLKSRGWDHMELVAQELSSLTGLPLLHPLRSARAADQRNLGRQQRNANRTGTFIMDDPEIVSHAPAILLIDDVLTTGSTCNAAADVLKAGGVHRVFVATYARVW